MMMMMMIMMIIMGMAMMVMMMPIRSSRLATCPVKISLAQHHVGGWFLKNCQGCFEALYRRACYVIDILYGLLTMSYCRVI